MLQRQIIQKPVKWNKCFQVVNESRHRYRCLRGSAGSGKSVNIAQDYIQKLANPYYEGANLLVLRKTEDTNRNSTFAELQSAINRIYGEYAKFCWRITTNPLMIENLQTGSQIIFRGMNDEKQREKVKSITFKKGKLTWIWLEEATEFAEADIDILDDRLRGELPNPNLYYQMTLTFNPVSAAHWIKKKYFDYQDPDILCHHSTYLQNAFIDDAYKRRMERRKIQDPEGYVVYGLGEWGELGGLILTNWTCHDFDFSNFQKFSIGQDFGFNHANAILLLAYHDGEIYVCKELYVYEKDTTEIIQMADSMFDRNIDMWCDSAEPDRIKMWKEGIVTKDGRRIQGFHRAKGVKKAPLKEKDVASGGTKKTYVASQIDWLKSTKIHIHPTCVNTQKEISQWKWQKDEKLNVYIDEPVAFMDDAMAALRYGIEPWRHYKPSILDVV